MTRTRFPILIVCLLVAVGAVPVAGAGAQAAEPTPIDSCTTITEPGEYVLTADVPNASGGACIRIAAADVVLDGQGHELNGTGGPGDAFHVGVFVTAAAADTNVTVRNLATTGWGFGVAISDLSTGAVENVTARDNAFSGVVVQYSSDVAVRNVTGENNSANGVYLLESSESTVDGANVGGNAADGVRLTGGANNSVANVTATGNGDDGVFVQASANTAVRNATASDNARFGVTILGGTNAAATDLAASGNGLSGVLVEEQADATVRGVDATGNGQNGLYLLNGTRLSASGIEATGNGLNGISIANATAVTVEDARVESSLGAGVRSADSSDVLVRDVAVANSSLAEVIAVGEGSASGETVALDGTTVSFEASDVSLDATIQPTSPPDGATNVGGYLRVTPLGDAASLGLTVHYADVSGVDEGTLGLWGYDAGWAELADSSVDVEGNAVSGSLDPARTTVVAVFGNATQGG